MKPPEIQENTVQDHDFDFEDSPGIPAPLPPGEQVVWQGKPDKWEMAKQAFHIRKIAVYFLLILAFQLFSQMSTALPVETSIAGEGASAAASAGASFSLTLLLSLLGVAILSALAWLTAHVTIYTVTNRRILIRFGVALQMTINLPFKQIKAADMRVGKNGFGDIPLTLKDSRRVSYIVLWPHVRPWQFANPQPMLRTIPNVALVAELVAAAAAENADSQSQPDVIPPQPHSVQAAMTQSEAL